MPNIKDLHSKSASDSVQNQRLDEQAQESQDSVEAQERANIQQQRNTSALRLLVSPITLLTKSLLNTSRLVTNTLDVTEDESQFGNTRTGGETKDVAKTTFGAELGRSIFGPFGAILGPLFEKNIPQDAIKGIFSFSKKTYDKTKELFNKTKEEEEKAEELEDGQKAISKTLDSSDTYLQNIDQNIQDMTDAQFGDQKQLPKNVDQDKLIKLLTFNHDLDRHQNMEILNETINMKDVLSDKIEDVESETSKVNRKLTLMAVLGFIWSGIKSLVSLVGKGLTGLLGWIKNLGPALAGLSRFMPILLRVLGPLGALIGGFKIGQKIAPMIDDLLSKVTGRVTSLGSEIYDVLHGETQWQQKTSLWINDTIDSVKDGIKDAFGSAMKFVDDMILKVSDMVGTIIDKISGFISYIGNLGSKAVNNLIPDFLKFWDSEDDTSNAADSILSRVAPKVKAESPSTNSPTVQEAITPRSTGEMTRGQSTISTPPSTDKQSSASNKAPATKTTSVSTPPAREKPKEETIDYKKLSAAVQSSNKPANSGSNMAPRQPAYSSMMPVRPDDLGLALMNTGAFG